jgi:hypothetical protein
MTGEDGTSDRDGHGMGDERSGDASGHRHARPEETVRGREPGDGSASGGDRPRDDGPEEKRSGVAATPSEPEHRQEPQPGPGPVQDARRASGPMPSDEHESPYEDSALEALLAAALRGEKSDGEAERRAVAAFRAARDAGAHRARTRRRDDWRPRSQRRRARSLKATFSVLLASLTLGGVAYAAIGSGVGGPHKSAAEHRDVRPSVSASTPAESHSSARPTTSAPAVPAERPPTAKDTLAHCRVYEKLRGRGKALDSTAFQRLVTAAGGEANVSAYCATLTGTGTADAKGAKGAKGAKQGKQKAKTGATQNADKNKNKSKKQ